MFSRNYSEGQQLSSSNPKEILLPEDPPFGMELLCRAIHHRIEKVPTAVDGLIGFVRLMDKYEVKSATSLLVGQWIANCLGHCEWVFECYVLLEACLILDDAQGFRTMTASLIKNWRRDWKIRVPQSCEENVIMYRTLSESIIAVNHIKS